MSWRAVAVACLCLAASALAASCGGNAARPVAPRPAPEQVAVGPPVLTPHRLARRFGRPGRDPVPILMYHVVAAAPSGAPYRELWTPPRRFAAQVAALQRAGFHGVTMSDVLDHWRRGLLLPPRPVVFSFDDGYSSQWRAAAPVLQRLGWPGVLFLVVHNLHVAGGLTPPEVRTLLQEGWELGAHTLTHPDLTTLAAPALRREVAGSRAALRREFGARVAAFCYPAGRVDPAVEAVVRAAGYRAATTTAPGLARPATDPYLLPRIRVDGATSPATLVRLASVATRSTSGRPS